MAKWNLTLNGNPARDAQGILLEQFVDRTGINDVRDANFTDAQRIAVQHLATVGDLADGMTVQHEQENSFNRVSGTHTFKS